VKEQRHLDNLALSIRQLKEGQKHLEVSYKRCQKVGLEGPYSEEDLIEFEALTSRFARVVDILVHKVFRSLDRVELIDEGTLIDVINRAEKRHLIESAVKMRAFKDLRNEIAHDYLAEKLSAVHREVYHAVPLLLQAAQKALNYAEKYGVMPLQP